jgi:hypothetical protein
MKISEIISNVVDTYEENTLEIISFLESNPYLFENTQNYRFLSQLYDAIKGISHPTVGVEYYAVQMDSFPSGQFIVLRGHSCPAQLIDIIQHPSHLMYVFDINGIEYKYPNEIKTGDRLSKTILFHDFDSFDKAVMFINIKMSDWEIRNRLL